MANLNFRSRQSRVCTSVLTPMTQDPSFCFLITNWTLSLLTILVANEIHRTPPPSKYEHCFAQLQTRTSLRRCLWKSHRNPIGDPQVAYVSQNIIRWDAHRKFSRRVDRLPAVGCFRWGYLGHHSWLEICWIISNQITSRQLVAQ